jgi:cytochrome c-type biogenesis protein CcmH
VAGAEAAPLRSGGITIRARWLISLCLLLVVLTYPLGAVEAQSGDLPYNEMEAQAIDRMLMCPVCPAETIDQAQVELARQMQQTVRDMLAAGKSREAILSFFVARYGPGVLAAPPKSGFNLVAWIFPAVVAVAGLAAAWLVLRSMAAQGRREPTTELQLAGQAQDALEGDLGPYLAVVDQELGQSRNRIAAPGSAATPGDRYVDESIWQARDAPGGTRSDG